MDIPRPYHHGDLRRALLDAALAEIAEHGPAKLSLRELARTVGVSHAAPRHHFGDKRGLLTAIAIEGFEMLAGELEAALESTASFLEVGVAYVGFAVTHRAHFEVMFRPELLRDDDPLLDAARTASSRMLYGPIAAVAPGGDPGDPRAPAIAAWSLVHGLATLWLSHNLPSDLADDPRALARSAAGYLFAGGAGAAGAAIRPGG